MDAATRSGQYGGVDTTTSKRRTARWWLVGIVSAAIVVIGIAVVVQSIGNHFVSGGTIHTVGERETLKPCRPLPSLQLSDLSTSKPPTCDLGGAQIEVSAGNYLTVPDTGGNMVTETDNETTYGIANLGGDLGVVVYTDTQHWGNDKAVELVRRAGWNVT